MISGQMEYSEGQGVRLLRLLDRLDVKENIMMALVLESKPVIVVTVCTIGCFSLFQLDAMELAK